MPEYALDSLVVVWSRDRWQVYGRSAPHGQHLHSHISHPRLATRSRAYQWVQNEAVTGGLYQGLVLNGYSGGDARPLCWNVHTDAESDPTNGNIVTLDFDTIRAAAFLTLIRGANAIAYGVGTAADSVRSARARAGGVRHGRHARVYGVRYEVTEAPARIARRPSAAYPDTFFNEAPPAGTLGINGIESVGIELECYVPTTHLRAVAGLGSECSRIEVYDDGSLNEPPSRHTAKEVTFWSTNLDEIKAFLARMYDDYGVKTNHTCGFHVHVKPRDGLTYAFAAQDYWNGFQRAYQTFADTRGERRSAYHAREAGFYCSFRPWNLDWLNSVLTGRAEYDSRFTAINLQSLKKHSFGTIEHRVLPHMMSAQEAVEAVQWLLNTASSLILAPHLTYAEVNIAPFSMTGTTPHFSEEVTMPEICTRPIRRIITVPEAPCMIANTLEIPDVSHQLEEVMLHV